MADDGTQPNFVIKTQYVKDQSFENPNAPEIYGQMAQQSPNLDINIDVTPQLLEGRTYEVTLSLRADAKIGQTSAFIVELEYAGVVSIGDDVDPQTEKLLLMVETPRHLFPFARAIMAGITREGGFPPLVINPIDFDQMFQARASSPADGADGPPAGTA